MGVQLKSVRGRHRRILKQKRQWVAKNEEQIQRKDTNSTARRIEGNRCRSAREDLGSWYQAQKCSSYFVCFLVFSFEIYIAKSENVKDHHFYPTNFFLSLNIYSTFLFSPSSFLVGPSRTHAFRLNLLRTSKHNVGSDDYAAEDFHSAEMHGPVCIPTKRKRKTVKIPTLCQRTEKVE